MIFLIAGSPKNLRKSPGLIFSARADLGRRFNVRGCLKVLLAVADLRSYLLGQDIVYVGGGNTQICLSYGMSGDWMSYFARPGKKVRYFAESAPDRFVGLNKDFAIQPRSVLNTRRSVALLRSGKEIVQLHKTPTFYLPSMAFSPWSGWPVTGSLFLTW